MGSLFPGQDPPLPPSLKGARSAESVDSTSADGLVTCATLPGETVIDRAGEVLGSLEHVLIDLPSGAITYGVLVRGGVFGLGERLHAFRWNAIRFEGERHRLVLDIDKAGLEAANGFDDDHWPAMTDAAWAAAADISVHKHRPV
jgi:hypothetical protein